MKKLKCWLLFLFIFFHSLSFAQYLEGGQDPANIKWRQISSKKFSVIYPIGFETQAKKVAYLLMQVEKSQDPAFVNSKFKTKVILHNFSTISNGMVVLAPRRMELYTCPEPDIYAQDWLEQLIIHESRHVRQIDLLNKNFVRFLYYIMGEQAESAVMGVFLPLWFLEGDAVVAETAMSNAGRGRSPSFTKEMKARIMADKRFSYDKAVFGSYRNYVPDHYKLGYMMTSYMAKQNEYKTWDKVIRKISINPIGFFRFNSSLYNSTRLNKVVFYKRMLKDYKEEFKKNDTIGVLTKFECYGKKSYDDYINYFNPQYIDSSNIVAEKYSFDKIGSFVAIDEMNNERKILTPGFGFNNTLSVSNQKLCWIEQIPDVRWENRSYNVVMTYDLKNKKKKQLTKKTRYFSASISKDSKKIACIEISPENVYSLVILNSSTGEVIDKITAPNNDLILQPSWSDDGKKLVLMILNNKGKSIFLFDLPTHLFKKISSETNVDIFRPIFYKNYILFTGAFNGTENIYALDTINSEIFQLTSSKFGASNVALSPNSKKIVYSEYNLGGTIIAVAKIKELLWRKVTFSKIYTDDLVNQISKSFSNPFDTKIDTSGLFKISNYSKLGHVVNLHSWAPLYIDASNPTATNKLGVALMSQNLLGTAVTTAGYGINNNSGRGEWKAGFSYKGFFPQFNIDYSSSDQLDSVYNNIDTLYYYYKRKTISTGVSLPIVFNTSYFNNGINIGLNNFTLNVKRPETIYSYTSTQNINAMNYYFVFYSLRKQSYRDLYPRLGEVIQLTYSHTPFKISDKKASIYNIKSTTYLPGLFKHNHISAEIGLQQKYGEYYIFSDIIRFPQGYTNIANKNMYSIQLNYSMPLGYPDFNLGGLIYIKRFKANIFYNYAKTWQQIIVKEYSSRGFDLLAEAHFFRFIFPVDFGIKAVKTQNSQDFYVSPIINLNINELGKKHNTYY